MNIVKQNRKPEKQKFSKGYVIMFLGHRLMIKKVKHESFGKIRYNLSCRTHCCTSPYGIDISLTEEDLLVLVESFKN